MVRAGWYDDPVGAQDLRWWDGSRWTAHVRDDPTSAPPPQAVARPPQAATPRPRAAAPPPQTAAPPPQAAAPPPEAAPPPPAAASRGGGRRLLPIVSLLVLGWLVVIGFRSENGSAPDPTPPAPAEQAPAEQAPAEQAPAEQIPADPVTVDAELGAVSAGTVTPFTVTADGIWVAEFEVPTGRLVIDVRGTSGFDPVTTLQDLEGRDLAFNDDRSTEDLDTFGGNRFDSLIDVRVEAGRYRVLVEEWSGNPGDAVLLLPIVGG